jgi:hypothetical protein
MDRFTSQAALAAAFVSVALTACGGGSSDAATAAPAAAPAPSTAEVDGVATPQSLSVVTAKNAD